MNTSYGWGIAVVMIVAVSWFLYRYLAPQSWKEWARAGLVQAFIIAFYAEMYGFPVTIYLLTRFFGLDAATTPTGNLWSYLFGFGDLPMLVAMIIGYAIVAVGVFMVIKGWREIYHARREGRLAKDGIYGIVRHPQYTGFFLAIFGEGIVHWPTLFSVAFFPVIVLAYFWLARKEEKDALEKFGDEYVEYKRHVPMFFPRLADMPRLFNLMSR